jgi:transcriptional regulator GlxA family with amidase domain
MKNWTLLLLAGLLLLANCREENPYQRDRSRVRSPYENRLQPDAYNVGFLIMDGVYNTELIAPWDVFHHTRFRKVDKPMNVFTIAKTLDPVFTFEGIELQPDYSYRDEERPRIDILVIPSADHHMDSDMEDSEMILFVREVAAEARYLTSHCDGAFILAKAGQLVNKKATTFPTDIDSMRIMFPNTIVLKGVDVVQDGKVITSTGGARSYDAALYLCELLYDRRVAREIAKGLVIDWDLSRLKYHKEGK